MVSLEKAQIGDVIVAKTKIGKVIQGQVISIGGTADRGRYLAVGKERVYLREADGEIIRRGAGIVEPETHGAILIKESEALRPTPTEEELRMSLLPELRHLPPEDVLARASFLPPEDVLARASLIGAESPFVGISTPEGEKFIEIGTGEEFEPVASAVSGGLLLQSVAERKRIQREITQAEKERRVEEEFLAEPLSYPAQYLSPVDPFGFTTIATGIGGVVLKKPLKEIAEDVLGVRRTFAKTVIKKGKEEEPIESFQRGFIEFAEPSAFIFGGVGVIGLGAKAAKGVTLGFAGLTGLQAKQTIEEPTAVNIGYTAIMGAGLGFGVVGPKAIGAVRAAIAPKTIVGAGRTIGITGEVGGRTVGKALTRYRAKVGKETYDFDVEVGAFETIAGSGKFKSVADVKLAPKDTGLIDTPAKLKKAPKETTKTDRDIGFIGETKTEPDPILSTRSLFRTEAKTTTGETLLVKGVTEKGFTVRFDTVKDLILFPSDVTPTPVKGYTPAAAWAESLGFKERVASRIGKKGKIGTLELTEPLLGRKPGVGGTKAKIYEAAGEFQMDISGLKKPAIIKKRPLQERYEPTETLFKSRKLVEPSLKPIENALLGTTVAARKPTLRAATGIFRQVKTPKLKGFPPIPPRKRKPEEFPMENIYGKFPAAVSENPLFQPIIGKPVKKKKKEPEIYRDVFGLRTFKKDIAASGIKPKAKVAAKRKPALEEEILGRETGKERSREEQSFAQLFGFGTRQTQRQRQRQRLIHKQTTTTPGPPPIPPPIIDELRGPFTPLFPPIPSLKTEFMIPKRQGRFKPPRQPRGFAPSLAASEFGITARKEPKGLLLGLELRPVVVGKGKKKRKKLDQFGFL